MKRKPTLARELFEIGLAAKRDKEGYNDGLSFDKASKGNQAAWVAIGKYVSKHFKRNKTKP